MPSCLLLQEQELCFLIVENCRAIRVESRDRYFLLAKCFGSKHLTPISVLPEDFTMASITSFVKRRQLIELQQDISREDYLLLVSDDIQASAPV